MAKNGDIKVTNTGKGVRLHAYSNGRWHSTALDSKKNINSSIKPWVKVKRKELLSDKLFSGIETRTGAALIDNAVSLNTNTFISLCNTATSKQFFKLPMGLAGQIKVIVHLTRANSVDMKLNMKIADGAATQQFVSDAVPKTLMVICDGTYWHPLGEFTGSGTGGEWEMT